MQYKYGDGMSLEAEHPEIKLLKQMQNDISFMKNKIIIIEEEVDEISSDLHRELNPEFLNRLESVQKQKGIRFNSMKEFDEYFSK